MAEHGEWEHRGAAAAQVVVGGAITAVSSLHLVLSNEPAPSDSLDRIHELQEPGAGAHGPVSHRAALRALAAARELKAERERPEWLLRGSLAARLASSADPSATSGGRSSGPVASLPTLLDRRRVDITLDATRASAPEALPHFGLSFSSSRNEASSCRLGVLSTSGSRLEEPLSPAAVDAAARLELPAESDDSSVCAEMAGADAKRRALPAMTLIA
mmetsp:Transcript_18091/g.59215  ORF Transcript_18091/g.59215 Transcript_18091/m.59215 type:complete len:216 (+) Transcript_18091:236-883(+)